MARRQRPNENCDYTLLGEDARDGTVKFGHGPVCDHARIVAGADIHDCQKAAPPVESHPVDWLPAETVRRLRMLYSAERVELPGATGSSSLFARGTGA
jgi:hypothetical protein